VRLVSYLTAYNSPIRNLGTGLSTSTHIITRTTDQRSNRSLTSGRLGVNGPGLALLGILIFTASIGFKNRLPALTLGITLEAPDVLLVGSLGWIWIQWLFVPGFRLVRTPLDLPMLIFFAVTLFSTLVAIAQASVNIHVAIQGIRVFSYYLTFFVVTNLMKEERQLRFLLNGIFVLATFVALAMIAQYMLGDWVGLIQSVAPPSDVLFQGGAVRRILPPGHSVLVASFVTSFCILVVERFRPMGLLRYLQCGLLGMAVLLTFLRSFWAVLILVLFLAAYLVRGAERRRLIGWGLVAMFPAVLALLVSFAAPDLPVSKLVDGALEKLSSVTPKAFTGGDANYNFRRVENNYALAAIVSHPVLGLGVGAAYRPTDPRLDPWEELGRSFTERTTFIHNSHLGILLQSGLLGYLSFVWLSVAFLLRGRRNWRRVPNDRMRAVVLGFTLVYLVALMAAPANSIFMMSSWVPVLGIVLGVNEVILRQVRSE
jgi:O-antigen ligase